MSSKKITKRALDGKFTFLSEIIQRRPYAASPQQIYKQYHGLKEQALSP
jgi:hypothetical protein